MGKINYIIRIWNTVKFLKLIQFYSRLKILIRKRSAYKNNIINFNYRNIYLTETINKNISLINKDEFIFFNLEGNVKDIGWQDESRNKLWRYNQNYLDDLNSKNANLKIKTHINILKNWIENNNDINLLPWDPYPTSLRIVNIIKWITRNSMDYITIKKIIESLALQSEYLYQNIEYHLMGNHLFTNAKALIFAGLFFDTPRSKIWANKGFNLMQSQLEEQILKDGGHFERSPMYHAIILEDILDVINIMINNKAKDLDIGWLLMLVKKMIDWMNVMNHPDNKISFFNDSAFNISSKSKDIIDYVKRLNILNEKDISKIDKLFKYKYSEVPNYYHLSASGYIASFSKNAYLIADIGKIGPDYIPSHAHADTLSYELSLFNKRVIVNSGTSTYENNKIRHIERSTKSHSTVELNNKNSSDVWSAFRVGKRAEPKKLKILDDKDYLKVSCSHNGYSSLCKEILHNRSWTIKNNNSIQIKDTIDGNDNGKSGFARHILHPEVKIKSIEKNSINLINKDGNYIKINILCGNFSLTKAKYSTEFGLNIDTNCLKVELENNLSKIEISW